jgi:hypothetical protein
MKSKLTNSKIISIGIAMAALSCQAQADTWSFNATPSLTYGSYSGSVQRDKLSEIGVMISADYLDQGGVTAGYSNTRVNLKNATTIDQNNYLLSGRKHIFLDSGSGRLTLRLDAHRLNNNDVTGATNGVSVIAPQVGWLSDDHTLYADLGYANSRYPNQTTVHQYTPTLGFGFNSNADWIQMRAYLISGLNPASTGGNSSTSDLDMKWTHYFAPGSELVPASVSLGVAAGKKMYAVDMDAQSVANLADLSKGAATLGLAWNINKNTKLFVLAGQSRYSNVAMANDYKLNVGYASLSIDW